MGLGRYLRRHIALPITRRIDMQSEILCELHLRALLRTPPYEDPKRLEAYGFRSFSQNDEDGILQEIFRRIGLTTGSFVEFGVQDGLQNNTRLLLYRGWKGLWIEADARACRKMRRVFGSELASGQLQLVHSFVTRENIGGLIEASGLLPIDLLSIDIDGNDYWVWKALTIQPRVVVIEYNAKFRPPTSWVMEYNAAHRWDYSDYQGASLQSLYDLGRTKGYRLVGCGLAGVNAFFVREDLAHQHFPEQVVADLYNPPRFYLQHFLSCGHAAGEFGPYRSI
jgi:hypothetical protein